MPPNPEIPFKGFDFSYDFLPEMDFGEDFCFGGDFSFLPELDVDFFKESSLLGVDSSISMMCPSAIRWRALFRLVCRRKSNKNGSSVLLTTPATEQV